MALVKDKDIVRGIQRRSSEDLVAPKMGLTQDSPANLSELIEASSKMSMKYDALTKEFGSGQRKMEAEEIKIRQKFAGIQMSEAEKRKATETELSAMRREVRAESEGRRYQSLREMDNLDKAISAVGEMYTSPNQMLLLSGLGTPERSEAEAQVATLPDSALHGAALKAISTANKALAAAVLTRMDKMTTVQRRNFGIDRLQLAEALVGEAHQKAAMALATSRRTFQRALNDNQSYNRGRPLPLTMVQDGLRDRQSPHIEAVDKPVGTEDDDE